MNRQGNRRTTKEGSSDLKFQNFSLPKNRSWPHISSPTGRYQAIKEPLLNCERNFAAAPDGAKCYSDDDYEDPKLLRAERWRALRLFPVRPAKEPEYADTRCFRGMMDTPLPRDGTTSIPMERQAWITQMRLEDVDKPSSQDLRSHHIKGDAPTKKGSKTPLPPPRPPVTLPKKYHPLPPEPESCRPSFPLRHTFPEAQGRSRQINLKNLSEVLGAEKVPPRQGKPESSCLLQNQNTQAVPVAVTSSSFLMSNNSVQKWGQSTLCQNQTNTDHQESMLFHPPQRCPSPASYNYHNNFLCYKNTSWRRPSPTRSEDKPGQWDAPHNEWYIGEYSRQAVEEALMKENKDGTFLVQDCSTKSRAEPYVLVVFYGNKVYNVKIRFLEKNQQFALGTGLRGDEKFNSVEDIIEHYKYFPIILIDGKDKSGVRRQQCYLARPLPLGRLHSAW